MLEIAEFWGCCLAALLCFFASICANDIAFPTFVFHDYRTCVWMSGGYLDLSLSGIHLFLNLGSGTNKIVILMLCRHFSYERRWWNRRPRLPLCHSISIWRIRQHQTICGAWGIRQTILRYQFRCGPDRHQFWQNLRPQFAACLSTNSSRFWSQTVCGLPHSTYFANLQATEGKVWRSLQGNKIKMF